MKVYERKIVSISLIYFKSHEKEWIEEGLKDFLSCMDKLYGPQGHYVDKDKLRKKNLSVLEAELEAEKAAGPAKNSAA